ncbi:MAG: hypothetical protein GX267_04610 [Fibrobacter sp.]|jgi:hypothetical protein|nr:hypothetical protein [Fibrobacter sp.]
MNLMLWLAPFFVVSLGFFLSRVKRLRPQRYVFYAVILFIAFLIDLNSLKFSNYRLDIALFLFVTLVFSELFWSIKRSRNKIFNTISLVTGILIFSYLFRQWFISGPVHVCSLWESQVVSEHSRGDIKYRVREPLKNSDQARTFKLYKCLKYIPMEKFMGKFTIPQGYDRAQFRFRWYKKNGAVMVDIIGDSDTLWTLQGGILE